MHMLQPAPAVLRPLQRCQVRALAGTSACSGLHTLSLVQHRCNAAMAHLHKLQSNHSRGSITHVKNLQNPASRPIELICSKSWVVLGAATAGAAAAAAAALTQPQQARASAPGIDAAADGDDDGLTPKEQQLVADRRHEPPVVQLEAPPDLTRLQRMERCAVRTVVPCSSHILLLKLQQMQQCAARRDMPSHMPGHCNGRYLADGSCLCMRACAGACCSSTRSGCASSAHTRRCLSTFRRATSTGSL